MAIISKSMPIHFYTKNPAAKELNVSFLKAMNEILEIQPDVSASNFFCNPTF